MKRFILAFWVCFGVAAVSFAQPLPLVCTETGAELEYADYDAEGSLTGYTLLNVVAAEPDDEGLLVVRRHTQLDASRQPVAPESEQEPRITRIVVGSESISLPADELLGPISGDDWQASVECQGDAYRVPHLMREGETLPDLKMTLVLSTENGFRLKVSLRISDRRVLSEGESSVPAGRFEAVCLSEKVQLRCLGFGMTTSIRTWYVPGIGEIRCEQLDKKGRLMHSSELVAVRRPE